MTRDEICELAFQCRVWIPLASGPEREQTIDRLRRFATLVAAAERNRIARAALTPSAENSSTSPGERAAGPTASDLP